MKPIEARPQTAKRVGEFSEAAFLLKAGSLGFGLAKPWGDSERYDFILDSRPRLWRVQLKCSATARDGGYGVQATHASCGGRKMAYTADDIDVLVVYILPRDTWYVLPFEVFAPRRYLGFYPNCGSRRAIWEKYREAWQLLRTSSSQTASDATDSTL